MAAYAIRVELRGDPSFQEYEKLHQLMNGLGFGRTVSGMAGVSQLPHATYYGYSNSGVEQVRDLVRDSVKTQIQNNILVFVAKTETWAMGW
jgi:hypothetical protein